MMVSNILSDLLHKRVGLGVSQVSFGDVAGVNRGLIGEQEKRFGDSLFFGRHVEGNGVLTGRQMRLKARNEFERGGSPLVTAFGELGQLAFLLLQRVEIGEDQLGIDHLNVTDGIDGIHDVLDLRIFEAAHHLDDGIHFADVGQELIPQPFTLAGTGHQTGNVNELEDSGHQLLGAGDLAEHG